MGKRLERYQYKLGDTVRVKQSPSAASRLNGFEWPMFFVGYIDSYSWSDRDEVDCAVYSLYGGKDTPVWGIQFAESDLELVETVDERRAKVPTTSQTIAALKARVAQLEGVLHYIEPNLPTERRDYELPGDGLKLSMIAELVRSALAE
jgi:hypothetical protein